ncbi:MAG: hypothetical protein A2583_10720 [Bdellovibrionales bacterium RIFOXYD1_FULL_53_11]|nr:MAG: hypothetical protein A2583_10720 [Bdellovibrionales bacterium RIFOXYD1_FULL_53_11]
MKSYTASIMALALLLLESPATGENCAGCDHKTTQSLVEITKGLKPLFENSNFSGIPVAFKPGFLSDGRYQTAAGAVVSKSCISFIKTSRPDAFKTDAAVTRKIDSVVSKMMAGINSCIKNRALSAHPAAIRKVLAQKPAIECGPPDDVCKQAIACAFHGENRIKFLSVDGFTSEDTWFHELLHLTKTDNKTPAEHNSNEPGKVLEDEIYFWSNHCFKPYKILADMRAGTSKACWAAKSHKGALKQHRYNERERKIHCNIYREYLRLETAYDKLLADKSVPELFRCVPHQGGGRCVTPDRVKNLLAKGANLKNITVIDDKNYRAVLAARCNWIKPGQHTSALDLSLCASGYIKDVTLYATSAHHSGAISAAELDEIKAWLAPMKAKTAWFENGPAKLYMFPEWAQERNHKPLTDALGACLHDHNLKDTSLCWAYRTTTARQMARLLYYWK